jgi:hypothetical protein
MNFLDLIDQFRVVEHRGRGRRRYRVGLGEPAVAYRACGVHPMLFPASDHLGRQRRQRSLVAAFRVGGVLRATSRWVVVQAL